MGIPVLCNKSQPYIGKEGEPELNSSCDHQEFYGWQPAGDDVHVINIIKLVRLFNIASNTNLP
jgi:hypothetical protein